MIKKLVCALAIAVGGLAAGSAQAAPLGSSMGGAPLPETGIHAAQLNVQIVPQRNFNRPPPRVYYAPPRRVYRGPPAYGRYYGPPRRIYRPAPAYGYYAPPPRRVVRERYYRY